jgi:hypothetical protein
MAVSVKTTAAVFELPQKLGIIQYVEYVPERQCADGRCLYEGVLTAEGCRRGICVRYRVRVYSRDRRRWEAKERWQRGEVGGCLSQAVADALWELAGQYDVGVWYEYRVVNPFGCMYQCLLTKECYLVINGVRLSVPYCSNAAECVERILEDYRRKVERLREPPPVANVYNPAEELLRKYPELEAFGVEWVKAWAPHARERLIKIAEVMRKYPQVAEVVKRKKAANPNPYAVEAYVAKDGPEVCILLAPSKTYCMQDGAVVQLDLSCDYDYKEKKMMCRPKGLLTFTAAAKEYVRIL